MVAKTMDELVSLCKRRGFVFQSSEIYGGLKGTYDYGPLGVELKNNLKAAWWKAFIYERDDFEGLDSSILSNRLVFKHSGHEDTFTDPLVDCKKCKQRMRADKLLKEGTCDFCGSTELTEPRDFNLMMKVNIGPVVDENSYGYLRPETAQGEFVNFLNVQRSMRAKVPFGIAQIGKAFRNEVTPGNFTFRTIEFEQMEHQWFCKADTSLDFYHEYKQKAMDFLLSIGFKSENLRFHDHDKLAHYAKAACDIQYQYPIGWEELNGIHHRGDWDLSRHQEFSGKSMLYLDPYTNEKYIPNDVEYSIGADRLTLAVLCEAYDEEVLEGGDTRVVMHFHPAIAPYKVAVLPLQKNLSEKALDVYRTLAKHFMVTYDEAGSIGKRYRRQDEIGTPMCVTIDFETLENNTVTIRDRDTMEQIRLSVDELVNYVTEKIAY